MSKYLVRTLVIPVAAIALISLILGYFVPWQGLFVNLATSFISVLITIVYVDRILQEHDRRLWASVSGRIRQRIMRFGHTTSLEIRDALGIDPKEVFDPNIFVVPSTEEKIKSEINRVTKEVINPSVLSRLNQMDNKAWKKLADSLEKFQKEGDSLIDLYGHKLDPELLQIILDIQNQASKVLSSYYVIPDILGTSEAHPASQAGSTAWHFVNLTIQLTGSAICEINGLALKLINL